MDTIRLTNKQHTLMIAHRGMSGLETENTCAAFVAAGNRSHFGIETDVHKTADGHFVVIHDDDTARVGEQALPVEDSSFEALRAVRLKDKDGSLARADLMIPTLEEYIGICRRYDKTAVLEFKNRFADEDIARIVHIIETMGHLENTVFISFVYENLVSLKQQFPRLSAQFLTGERDDHEWLCSELASKGIDIDVQWGAVTRERVAMWHAAGLKVNCWTVDHPDDAARLIDMGVDYITTNILE